MLIFDIELSFKSYWKYGNSRTSDWTIANLRRYIFKLVKFCMKKSH